MELYPDVAPITVENFKKLAADGHYDGSIFHRVISGFMIQGGQSPTGEDAEQIVGEFSANGVSNSLKHERGVISMARLGDAYYDHYYYNTASDQFFIVHETPVLQGRSRIPGTKTVEPSEAEDAIPTLMRLLEVPGRGDGCRRMAPPDVRRIRKTPGGCPQGFVVICCLLPSWRSAFRS